ncbi:MAG: CpsD/CapB family tyrosine-protein kinase [Lachnospiraceae bacterium]
MKNLIFKDTGSDSHGIIDSMNTLKTNVVFCGDEVQVIALTSCVPGEGKSSIAFELTKSLADSDNKVLLIDADIRNSKFLRTRGIRGIEIGLTNYLSGKVEMEDIFYKVNINNMVFVPTGTTVPNPTVLIDNEKFEKLIEISRRSYNYIIVNATPIGMVIDAAIVARQCDGLVMVVEQGKNNKRMIGRAVEQLKRTETRILGAVLNKVN